MLRRHSATHWEAVRVVRYALSSEAKSWSEWESEDILGIATARIFKSSAIRKTSKNRDVK